MHPSAPVESAAPAPSDALDSQAAYLEDVMAQAEIAANAQRDIESGNNPSPSPARQEAQPGAPEEDEEDESDESVPGQTPQDDEGEDESEEQEEGETQPEPEAEPVPTSEQPRYSRRDASRFAAELEATRKTLEAAQSQFNQQQGELAHVRQTDQQIRNHLGEQSGYVRETNGRFRYENLQERVLDGTATAAEAEEVARMRQWHVFAGPIFRAAEEMVTGAFAQDWNGLSGLNGVGAEGLSRLNGAPTPIAASRELHAMAYAAGHQEAKRSADAQISRLRAEIKSLKTSRSANGPQPATSAGAGVASPGGWLSRAIDPKTGLSNPDFDREVSAGKWLGADLSRH
jgi:hypothetical protein